MLTLLSSPESADSDAALGKLGEFLGLSCKVMEAGRFLGAAAGGNGVVVAVHARTLRSVVRTDEEVTRALFCRTSKVLVYGFTASPEDARLLQVLTAGVVSGGEPVPAGTRTYAFGAALDRREVPLAGLACQMEDAREVFTFTGAASGMELTTLVSVNGRPLLASRRMENIELFLLSDGSFADLDALIERSGSVRECYATLLPATVLLRTVFRQACWNNPFPAATVIIDDPLIRRRYGFVEYEPLLTEARTRGYAVTIAFIPFNHARSDRRTAEFLRGHLDRFSLAVHGCDHTGNEFGATDSAHLRHKARLALDRMGRHRESTSLPFDPVMVFPQGLYSTVALQALKRSGYCAAVNSTAHPVDGDRHPLALRHLLDGAMTAYHSFPVFLRRYPRSVFDFAVDLLFGKPALLVEHHGYFKSGYRPLATFVEQLNGLAQGLAWVPLGEAVTSHALFRSLARDRFAVRFYTPRFRLRNPVASRTVFVLEKPEMESSLVELVAVDGRRVTFTAQSGTLACEIELGPHATCQVEVGYRDTPEPRYQLSLGYRCAAATRRYLSEIRDNYLARSDCLHSLAMRLKKAVRPRRGRAPSRSA